MSRPHQRDKTPFRDCPKFRGGSVRKWQTDRQTLPGFSISPSLISHLNYLLTVSCQGSLENEQSRRRKRNGSKSNPKIRKQRNKQKLNNHQVQKISMSPEMGDEAQCKKWGHRNEAGRGDRKHLWDGKVMVLTANGIVESNGPFYGGLAVCFIHRLILSWVS